MWSTTHGNRDTRRSPRRVRPVAPMPLVLYAFALGGCGHSFALEAADSEVVVGVQTTGASLPTENYTAWIHERDNPNRRNTLPIAPDGVAVFIDLGSRHYIETGISDIPDHCRLEHHFQRELLTRARESVGIGYEVTCSQIFGALDLTIAGLPAGTDADVTVSRDASSSLPAVSMPVITSQETPWSPRRTRSRLLR